MEENKIPETVNDDLNETVSDVVENEGDEINEVSEPEQISDDNVNNEEELKKESAAEEISDDNNEAGEEGGEAEADSTPESEQQEADTGSETPKKKKRIIQTPVIISACLVLLVLLSYFIFTSFLLKEPEGIVWTGDVPLIDSEGNVVNSTYYYEFDKDNVFKAYVGSVEIKGNYNKSNGKGTGKVINVGIPAGVFRMMEDAKYEITGSRILNNQELKVTYSDGTEFTLKQSKLERPEIELPKDFEPDNKLIGEWVSKDTVSESFHVKFGEDGSMSYGAENDTVNYSVTYNGSYTLEGDHINFTHYTSTSSVVAPLEYQLVDDNTLFFMGAFFVKADSLATADQSAK